MDKKRLKNAYVPPQTEVCVAEPYRFMEISFVSPGGNGHVPGDDNGTITGAKGFGLDDDWGKVRGLNPNESWGDLWEKEKVKR